MSIPPLLSASPWACTGASDRVAVDAALGCTGEELYSRTIVKEIRYFDSEDSFIVAVIRLADDSRPHNLLCNLMDVLRVLTNGQMTERVVSIISRCICLSQCATSISNCPQYYHLIYVVINHTEQLTDWWVLV